MANMDDIRAATQARQPTMEEVIEKQREALYEKFGRIPIGMDDLIQNINEQGWPAVTIVHPLDFFFLSNGTGSVHKDAEGPYFYLSTTKVRPAKGTSETLDLRWWTPPKVSLARFA